MRITNVMISNTMLGNINNNQRITNRLLNQVATGRLINNPSENPLMATRHMRFQNTLNQIEQHRRNVNQAEAWTAVTEQAIQDLTSIMSQINEYLQQADALENLDERKILANGILSLLDEKMQIMNKSFAGRYIFSGLRTDQPPLLVRDMPTKAIEDIQKEFNGLNLETTHMLDRSDHSNVRIEIQDRDANGDLVYDVNGDPVMVPAYRDADGNLTHAPIRTQIEDAAGNMVDAYILPDGTLTYDGTLAGAVEAWDTEEAYGPDRSRPNVPGTIQVHRINLPHHADEGSVVILRDGEPPYPVPTIPRTPQGDIDFAAMSRTGIYHDPETGQLISLTREDNAFSFSPDIMENITVQYDQTGFRQGDINPLVHSRGTLISHPTLNVPVGGMPFHNDNQAMYFEFGIHARMPINIQAQHIMPAQVWADIRGFANDIVALTPQTEVELTRYFQGSPHYFEQEEARQAAMERRAHEMAVIETVTNDRFNNLIGRFEGHNQTISIQQTEIGTRMSRLEMIYDRLEDDNTTFENLEGNNIGVDIPTAIMRLSLAEVALQASMQAGMNNIMTMTLLNFL